MAPIAMDAVACTACRTGGDKPAAVAILSGQTEAVGDRGRLAAAGHAQLGKDAGDVDTGCPGRGSAASTGASEASSSSAGIRRSMVMAGASAGAPRSRPPRPTSP